MLLELRMWDLKSLRYDRFGNMNVEVEMGRLGSLEKVAERLDRLWTCVLKKPIVIGEKDYILGPTALMNNH